MSERPHERISPQEYQRFFELSRDLLCIGGVDGYFKALNSTWEKVLGWSIEELLAKPYLDFVHPDDRQSTVEAALQLEEGVEIVSFDNRYLSKDGSYHWLHWSAVPTGRGHVYCVARDMTQRKEAETALAAAKDAAEATTKAKSAFLTAISHELRTPLNSVIGFSNLLLAGDEVDRDTVRVYLERIKANGESLLLMINELLDLEKVEAGRMDVGYEEVDLGLLVREVMARFEADLLERPVELRVEVPQDLPLFKTDYQKLTQILTNLVGNAVKFTDEGSVTVRVRSATGSPVPDAIEVEDTGIGIPEDKLERIFERFEQIESGTTRRYPGTGLGLAISRALCELMDYELDVESEVGRGTTFSIRLAGARVTDSVEALDRDSQTIALRLVREIEAESRQSVFHQRVVLVIDGQQDSRDLLSQLFRDLGCQVLVAATASQGLRLASEHSPDLITLDIVMPATTGWRLLGLLKADPNLRSIPVVIISTMLDDQRAVGKGVAGCLPKPVTARQLKRMLCRQLTPRVGRVLVVDASPAYRERIGFCLETCAEELRFAASGEIALDELTGFTPDLAVIGLEMPQMDGRELVVRIRHLPVFRHLPIILTSDQALKPGELEDLGRELAPVVRKGPRLEENLRELCWAIRSRQLAASVSMEQ